MKHDHNDLILTLFLLLILFFLIFLFSFSFLPIPFFLFPHFLYFFLILFSLISFLFFPRYILWDILVFPLESRSSYFSFSIQNRISDSYLLPISSSPHSSLRLLSLSSIFPFLFSFLSLFRNGEIKQKE